MIELALNEENYSLQQFTPSTGRYYERPDGQQYYSITRVLSILSEEGIQAWRAKVGNEEANRISKYASSRGTEVHDMIETHIRGDDVSTKDLLAMQNFTEIKPIINKSLGKVHALEQQLYSDHLGLAGTVDCVGEWDGKLSIIDWKTSRKYKKKEWISSYFMQATAYAIMWEERTGTPITQLVVCIAGDTGPQVFIEHRDNWDRGLIKVINEFKRRKIFDN